MPDPGGRRPRALRPWPRKRPSRRERYWVKPSGKRLGEVTAADLLLVDLDGRVLAGDREPHGELPYRARRDAEAVIHTHPFHTAALAASTGQFEMVSQDSVLFAGGIGRFDTAQLILTRELGRGVAEALGNLAVAILRNHGLVVAGTSIEEAVVLAVSFERSVATQLAAEQLGGVASLSLDEVEDLAQSIRARGQRRIAGLYRALASRVQ